MLKKEFFDPSIGPSSRPPIPPSLFLFSSHIAHPHMYICICDFTRASSPRSTSSGAGSRGSLARALRHYSATSTLPPSPAPLRSLAGLAACLCGSWDRAPQWPLIMCPRRPSGSTARSGSLRSRTFAGRSFRAQSRAGSLTGAATLAGAAACVASATLSRHSPPPQANHDWRLLHGQEGQVGADARDAGPTAGLPRREIAERSPRGSREAAERQPSRETAEREPRESRERAEG